ncbi:MAG: class A beta-lactamase-related serine hydrolase [Rhodospirillaceae bacterium]|nr:MAG: class A beta-lactamase-related serine hydrolase [Rhodospirillaceae bacterium]
MAHAVSADGRMEIRRAVIESGKLVEAHDADQLVPWWSFTKAVIAMAALVLVRDGRLALDEPLVGRPYTLRQLLQHRAGLTEYGALAAYHEAIARGDDPWPVAELLERTQAHHLRYGPGQGWNYSNIGYLFVRQLMEETCGESLDDTLKRLVLRPLGIDSARMALIPIDLVDVAMGSADSYHPGWVYHGLLIGTLQDAALFLNRLLTGEVLPRPLRDEMPAAHNLGGPIPGRPWRTPGYGLGLMVGTTSNELKAVGHTGGGPGSTIAVYHLPEKTPPLTVAAFAFSEIPGPVEEAAVNIRW